MAWCNEMNKVFPCRFEPEWLASVSEEHPLPLYDLLQNSLYYPASGLDGDPVRYFAGFIHSFVYADSSISKEAITEDLYRRGHGFTGYRVLFCKDASTSIKAGGSTLTDQVVKVINPVDPERGSGGKPNGIPARR